MYNYKSLPKYSTTVPIKSVLNMLNNLHLQNLGLVISTYFANLEYQVISFISAIQHLQRSLFLCPELIGLWGVIVADLRGQRATLSPFTAWLNEWVVTALLLLSAMMSDRVSEEGCVSSAGLYRSVGMQHVNAKAGQRLALPVPIVSWPLITRATSGKQVEPSVCVW